MKRSAIERLLPGVYQASVKPQTPLAALLDVMEHLHEPDEEILADLDRYFDPYLAPARFVDFLARWVDVDWLLGDADAPGSGTYPAGVGHLRNVIATAPKLSAHRGTTDGLRMFLERATGVRGFVIEETAGGRSFHIRVVSPPAIAASGLLALVERIVEHERPVHVTYEIEEGLPPPPIAGVSDVPEVPEPPPPPVAGAGVSDVAEVPEPLEPLEPVRDVDTAEPS